MAEAQVVFTPPESLSDTLMHYCPGCTHGSLHRLVAEIIDELGVRESTVGICPVGCAVYAYNYFEVDMIEAAHGRAPAVATGVKRVRDDCTVFTYQGDGDLASIGMGEIVHAAARNEAITVVFVNNGVFGMTQGQMAPTTLIGQKASTAPAGRRPEHEGFPVRVVEMLNALEGPTYLARSSMASPRWIRDTKKKLRNAFKAQTEHHGFGLVEVLSSCPTWWGMTPKEALDWMESTVVDYYPIEEFRALPEGDTEGE
ncbi:MAG: 2-oxoglutarate oxidoreductase [Armatimonadia bacterium]|nr:2-oxoglutarate oxidoreductase [Armatimonadia bacterium]